MPHHGSLVVQFQYRDTSTDTCYYVDDVLVLLIVVNSVRVRKISFGVGIGDCVRVIELIDTIVETLRHAGRANSEFQTLTVQLNTLRTALQTLEDIDVDDTLIGERLALKHASSQCHSTIDDFWKRMNRY